MRRVATLGLIFVIMIATAPATAVVPSLAATTVIEGTSGSMLVQLTSEARMDAPDDQVDLEPSGGFAAVVLSSTDTGITALFAAGARTETVCSLNGCSEWPPPYVYGIGPRTPRSVVLPAGEYRLSLLTDGPAARIELRFNDLTGETTLAPSEPVIGHVADLDDEFSFPQTRSVTWSSAARALDSEGLIFAATFAVYDPAVASQTSLCIRRGSAEGGPLSGCHQGGWGWVGAAIPGADASYHFGSYEAGTWGMGVWRTAAGAISRAESWGLWFPRPK